MNAPFAVNGRFLTQPTTGVQRYARQVVAAMDESLAARGESAPILVPAGADDPGHASMPLRPCGPFGGHLWEQLVLPSRCPGRLLNLTNTGPAAKRDQVVCIHDANVFLAPYAYGRGFRTAYHTLQPLLARRSARITTVSAFSAEQIAAHLPIAASQIAVLPNGHEHALAWRPEAARIAPAMLGRRDHPERPYILALGSRAKHKNLSLLVGLAPALDALGIDLVVVGGSGTVFTAQAAAEAPNLLMLGPLNDDELAYLLDHALCLAFPSFTEGFGLPLVEAMARSCPVVSSNRASMPEVCGEAALFAAPDDPAAWLGHFRVLLGSRDLAEDLAGRGRARVRHFSWTETAAAYLSLMEKPEVDIVPNRATAAPAPLPRIGVIIATTRRPRVVEATVRHLLATQSVTPASLIVSCVTREDAGALADDPSIEVLTGSAGLAAQRNRGLGALPDGIDVVVFFDDDFIAERTWLHAAARIFHEHADVVGLTGHVLADGIKGPGLAFEEAVRIAAGASPIAPDARLEPFSPYGCNMAFRVSAIADTRFDERLVLYGWLEDRDFGGSLARRGGRLVKTRLAAGVHMGVKSGRGAGNSLGYSQVVNPLYMHRKGTMTTRQAAGQIARNVASNLALWFRPEPYVDRRGRLRGNLRGFADAVRGRLEPERARQLTAPRTFHDELPAAKT